MGSRKLRSNQKRKWEGGKGRKESNNGGEGGPDFGPSLDGHLPVTIYKTKIEDQKRRMIQWEGEMMVEVMGRGGWWESKFMQKWGGGEAKAK